MQKPRIVILGAGYGGMMTTTRLTKKLGTNDAHITLVNKHNYHYQTTWLHEVAAGTIHQDRARMLISDVIDTKRVNLVCDSVVEIKKDENRVILENGELEYDYLVIGLGFESATFGIKGLKENAFSIRSVDTCREIRDHIEYQFARYHNEEEDREELLTIIVGGAGFTGIEFVGELAARIPELCKEYDIDREKVRLINIEAAPSVLPGFDEELVEYAQNLLESRGVEFMIDTKIQECTEDSVIVGSGEEIKSASIIWTGGVQGNSVMAESGFETNRGKLPVESDLRAKGYDNIFVIGDCALVINPENERPFPPTAQIAMQEAGTVATNLKALIRGEKLESFKFDNKGTVASLGNREAVGIVFGDHKLYGSTAMAMKKIIDDRYLMMLGGPGLVLKKGKLNLIGW
ncbi:MAG TPA: NAD(P)/FAD-dependent oxidoreductase [Bacillales bacterium]|nr:NAD(P)/FAD-dependent oxidoreductase [Bacillales bacterium]